MKISDYYKYSWFSDLAYVDWRGTAVGPTGKSEHAIEDANARPANGAPRIPGDAKHPGVDNLGDRIFMKPSDGGRNEADELWQGSVAYHHPLRDSHRTGVCA